MDCGSAAAIARCPASHLAQLLPPPAPPLAPAGAAAQPSLCLRPRRPPVGRAGRWQRRVWQLPPSSRCGARECSIVAVAMLACLHRCPRWPLKTPLDFFVLIPAACRRTRCCGAAASRTTASSVRTVAAAARSDCCAAAIAVCLQPACCCRPPAAAAAPLLPQLRCCPPLLPPCIEHCCRRIPPLPLAVLMYDDVAHSESNPHPGQLFNAPGGPDVYAGITIVSRLGSLQLLHGRTCTPGGGMAGVAAARLPPPSSV